MKKFITILLLSVFVLVGYNCASSEVQETPPPAKTEEPKPAKKPTLVESTSTKSSNIK